MERKLAAILCADVFGYSRLMGEDEEATLHTLTSHRKLIDSQIEQHHGRFVNSAGDSVLAEFASVVEAVNCAVEIQTGLRAENASLAPERRMEFRIGVNLGDVMVEGDQIHGDGVNVAARVESLAEPGGLWISGIVHEQVRDKLALSYEDCGEQTVKNIARPVHVWRVLLDGAIPTARKTGQIPRRYWRSSVLSLAGLAIVIAMIVLVQHVSFKPQTTHASIPPQEKPTLPLPDMPSIAVLPFRNLSGDPQQEYFSDGISDQLINNLSRLPGLFVIARNSSFAYKGKPTKESEIGKELGVKYLLEGSVRKAADQVRIGVELVDASSGTETWTQNYNGPLKDIFAVQDEIVDKVVTTLGLLIKLDEMRLPHGGPSNRTQNLEAYDDFLRALSFSFRFTKEDNSKARHWAERSIELDPKSADAYALVGASYWQDVLFRWSQNPQEDLKHSAEFAQKALMLDDSNSSALDLMCEIDWMQRRFERAVAEGERAVAMNPNDPNGYQALSDALINSDKFEEAVEAAKTAMRLDPAHQAFYAYFVGSPYVFMGRYNAAIALLQKHISVFPDNLWAHAMLAMAYVELGRNQDARTQASEVMRINPQFALPPPERETNESIEVNKHFQNDMRKAGLK